MTDIITKMADLPKAFASTTNITRKFPTPFIQSLWEMMEDTSHDQYVRWNDTGDGILILEPDALMVKVLPKFFKYGKLCSFVRQLNMYGFSKQKNTWLFKHSNNLFLKGRPDLLHGIQRRVAVKKKRIHDANEDTRPTKRLALDNQPSPTTARSHSPSATSPDSVATSISPALENELQSSELFDYESRQQVQETTINWLLSTVHQQRAEMAQLRVQMGVLTQYILKSDTLPKPAHVSSPSSFSSISPAASASSSVSVSSLGRGGSASLAEEGMTGLAIESEMSDYNRPLHQVSQALPNFSNQQQSQPQTQSQSQPMRGNSHHQSYEPLQSSGSHQAMELDKSQLDFPKRFTFDLLSALPSDPQPSPVTETSFSLGADQSLDQSYYGMKSFLM